MKSVLVFVFSSFHQFGIKWTYKIKKSEMFFFFTQVRFCIELSTGVRHIYRLPLILVWGAIYSAECLTNAVKKIAFLALHGSSRL